MIDTPYDLNHIPLYREGDKQIEGTYLIGRVPEEIWTEVHNSTWGSDQNLFEEEEMQEGKVVVWAGFMYSWGKKWKAMEKGKAIPS